MRHVCACGDISKGKTSKTRQAGGAVAPQRARDELGNGKGRVAKKVAKEGTEGLLGSDGERMVQRGEEPGHVEAGGADRAGRGAGRQRRDDEQRSKEHASTLAKPKRSQRAGRQAQSEKKPKRARGCPHNGRATQTKNINKSRPKSQGGKGKA